VRKKHRFFSRKVLTKGGGFGIVSELSERGAGFWRAEEKRFKRI
jgi:hypothetical protein